MKSKVYLADAIAGARRSLLKKLSDLFDESGGPDIFGRGDRVAVKVHFGEEGNTSYLEPSFARLLVNRLKKIGARPFLTDTNTIYRGKRHTTADHLLTAARHGFTEESVGAPIIIGDEFHEEVVEGLGKVRISRPVWEADGLLLVTHPTGHMLFGYAGAIKNISMGCASPSGKQVMHSDLKPEVNKEKCTGCGTCLKYCPVDAITLVSPRESNGSAPVSSKLDHYNGDGKIAFEGKKVARIEPRICVGCGECVSVCPEGAIPVSWKTETPRLAAKSAAYAASALAGKEKKLLCFNILVSVTPDCDCCDWSEPPFVPDMGILAARDPLAVDQATVDLIRKAPLIPGSDAVSRRINVSRKKIPPGVSSQFFCLPRLKDKFKSLFGVEIEPFLEEAERAGLGSRSYELKNIS